MKKILAEAADVGAVTVRTLAARPRDDMFYFYPGEGVWSTPFPGGSHEFLDNGARVLDARAYFHFYATGITPAMTAKMVGKGSQYAVAYVDANGNAFDGSKTYKVHLPPNVPAKDFWSFTLYDNQTRAMLQTDQQFPGSMPAWTRASSRTPTVRTTSTSAPSRRQVRKATGSRPFPARAGTCCSASTARCSPGSTRPGGRVIPSWLSNLQEGYHEWRRSGLPTAAGLNSQSSHCTRRRG